MAATFDLLELLVVGGADVQRRLEQLVAHATVEPRPRGESPVAAHSTRRSYGVKCEYMIERT